MKKEAKQQFCLNIWYTYDTEHNWDKEYIMEKLEEIATTAGFDTEESAMFMIAIENTCHIRLKRKSDINGSSCLKNIAERFRKVFG